MKTTNKLYLLATIVLALTGCSTNKAAMFEPVGKTSAPISMTYNVLNTSPKAGEQIEIEVSFQSSANSPINSSVNDTKKLTWLNAEKSWQSTLNKSGERAPLPSINVIAEENGIHFIHLSASVEVDGRTMSKAFTIPLQVGDGEVQLKSSGDIVVDDKGQRVIVQKAKSND